MADPVSDAPPAPRPSTQSLETPRAVLAGHEAPAGRDFSGAPSKAFGVIGNILRIPLLPFIFVFRPLIFRTSERAGTQIALFTSFGSLIYCWPIIIVGFLGAALDAWGVIHAPTSAHPGDTAYSIMGWVWLITVLFTLVVLGTDVSRNVALVWILVIGLLITGGAFVNAQYHIPVLGNIYDYFARLNVQFDKGTAVATSVVLLIVLFVVVVHALLDGRHEISSREVTHRHFLRASESWPLNINRVRLDWPDLLEMIVLFGAGHLVIIDQDRREVLRIPNIPFLWFFRDEVNRILDIMATTEVPASEAATARV